MEGFQAAGAAVGLARDVAALIQYLRMVKAAMDTVEDDLDGLIKELNSLNELYKALEEKYVQQPEKGPSNVQIEDLKIGLSQTLTDVRSAFDKIDKEVRTVYGDEPKTQGRVDAFYKQRRLRGRYPKIAERRDQIHTYNEVLQTYLLRISLVNQDSSREHEQNTSATLQEVQASVEKIYDNMRQRQQSMDERASTSTLTAASIAALDRVSASLMTSEPVDINKYFDIPQPVDSNYIGREDKATKLADAFFSPTHGHPDEQKRFVIYGVGGSGKTQFCCKFAQDHQQRFWGVFWIDGRSIAQLKQTLARNVAKVAEVDPNHNAAINWLGNRGEPWLLIIDNADDANIDLMEYLPKGRRGHVLITTRNPGYQSLGNVGPRYFKFDGLDEKEANALLFRTAGLSESSEEARSWAAKIVDALGYLALAISIAGSAINSGCCKLHEYIQYFEDMWQERLRLKHRRDAKRDSTDFNQRRQARVEVTFEISYKAIRKEEIEHKSQEARDALQLLKTFAYLHCENVHYKFLETCVDNAVKEKEQQAIDMEAAAKAQASAPPKNLKQWTIDWCIRLLTAMYSVRGPEALPQLLRDSKKKEKLDIWRVKNAMGQLTRYSLVTYNSKADSWSMHPLVHKWAREMIETKVGEQYLYCSAAATLLCDCVYLQQVDEDLVRQLLPHVDQVRKVQAKLEKRLVDNRMSRMKPWPVFESSFSAHRAITMAKFSIVYMQSGRFEDAEELQKTVQRFTVEVLGYKDIKTRRITKLLATTLYYLGKSDESANLLEQLLEACQQYCGPSDHETLMAMHALGESRFLQGRVSDSKGLFESAFAGLQSKRDPDGGEHEDTLTVMVRKLTGRRVSSARSDRDALGNATRLWATDEAFKKSRALHVKTVRIRTKRHGADDLKTVSSREFLYSAATWDGTQEDLLEADKGLAEVIEIRKKKLGREHAFTLLATLNQARVKVVLEQFKAADELFSECLPIAERNHGPNHMAILFARFCLGRLRCREKRWKEARDILVDVTERQKTALQGWGRDHLDRLGGLLELVKAHDALGEHDERDEVTEEALRIFRTTTTTGMNHPWARRLRANSDEWKRKRERGLSENVTSESSTGPRDGPLSTEEGLGQSVKELASAIQDP